MVFFTNKNLVYTSSSLRGGFLKCGPFKFIIPKDSSYFGYIDNILLIYNDLTKIMDKFNKMEPTIKNRPFFNSIVIN